MGNQMYQWIMHFNPSKFNVICFCPKRKETEGEYFIHGTKLERLTHSKYLGVGFDQNFKWTRHINKVVKKATQMLGFISHNIHSCPKSFKEAAYKSLVCPHLEYGDTVWDLYTQKDTYCLEMVQRKSARFVQSDYRHRSSVTRMLEGLKWESLKDWCTICQLTMVFKILNREVAIPSEDFFEFNCTRTRHGHPKKLTRYQPKTDVLKYAFAPWTIPEWNDLPEEVVGWVTVKYELCSTLNNLWSLLRVKRYLSRPWARFFNTCLGQSLYFTLTSWALVQL